MTNMELSFCNFIITVNAIFFNKGVILIEGQNQIAPFPNFLFQHLNDSPNVTETKIDLMDEISKHDPNIRVGNTLDSKDKNQTCQNMGFYLYENTTGYLARSPNETPITAISDFKESVLKDLPENIIKNSNSSKNATSGLSALGIEILSDYLRPVFIQTRTTAEHLKDKQKREFEILKRSKRQTGFNNSGRIENNGYQDVPRDIQAMPPGMLETSEDIASSSGDGKANANELFLEDNQNILNLLQPPTNGTTDYSLTNYNSDSMAQQLRNEEWEQLPKVPTTRNATFDIIPSIHLAPAVPEPEPNAHVYFWDIGELEQLRVELQSPISTSPNERVSNNIDSNLQKAYDFYQDLPAITDIFDSMENLPSSSKVTNSSSSDANLSTEPLTANEWQNIFNSPSFQENNPNAYPTPSEEFQDILNLLPSPTNERIDFGAQIQELDKSPARLQTQDQRLEIQSGEPDDLDPETRIQGLSDDEGQQLIKIPARQQTKGSITDSGDIIDIEELEDQQLELQSREADDLDPETLIQMLTDDEGEQLIKIPPCRQTKGSITDSRETKIDPELSEILDFEQVPITEKHISDIELHSTKDLHADKDNTPSTFKISGYQTRFEDFIKRKYMCSRKRSNSINSIQAKISKKHSDQQFSNSRKSTIQKEKETIGEQSKVTFNELEGGKTKRILSIEKAASEISKKNCHNYNYNQSLDLLKGYLLSPNENPNSQPTYNQFVDDFCKDLQLIEKYKKWVIPKHRLIDEVLFQPYFQEEKTETKVKKLLNTFKTVKNRKEEHDLYENSLVLQNYLSIQDFLILRMYFRSEQRKNVDSQKQLTFALLRLSLKECERETLENNSKLYRFESFRQLSIDTINKIYPGDTYTFDKITSFSSHKKPWKGIAMNTLRIEIELENTAGIPNTDLIFEDTGFREENYLIPLETTFKIFYKGEDLSSPFRYKIILQDNRTKEEKMIAMIKKMDDLLKESHLFTYY